MSWDNYLKTHPYYEKEINESYKMNLINFFNFYKIKYANFKCLEIGSGHGIYTVILLSIFKHITATEPNDVLFNELNKLKSQPGVKNLTTINTSVEKITPGSKTFEKYDMIICFNVFFLIEDKKKILKKFKKLLNPNGYILIMEPLKFMKFDKDNKMNKKMMDSCTNIYNSKQFNIIYHGIVLPNLICYLLQI